MYNFQPLALHPYLLPRIDATLTFYFSLADVTPPSRIELGSDNKTLDPRMVFLSLGGKISVSSFLIIRTTLSGQIFGVTNCLSLWVLSQCASMEPPPYTAARDAFEGDDKLIIALDFGTTFSG